MARCFFRTCTSLCQCVHGHCACGSRHASLRKFGAAAQSTHVARMTHWGSGSSDSGLPDNTAVKGCCATSGRNPSRCGEAKRRTQLVSKTKDEQRPSGQASAAWRAWVRMHTSKKCFAESDTTFEAAQSCRPTVMPSAWVVRPQRAASMEQLCQAC